MSSIRTSHGLAFEVLPVFFFTDGSSAGRQVATAAFQLTVSSGRRRIDVTLEADVDGALYPEARAACRRAGRAAVSSGVRVAKAISQGLQPLAVLADRFPPRARASWLYDETYEGFGRRVRVVAEYPFEGRSEADLGPSAELVEQVVRCVRAVSDGLHGALEDPAHRAVFGAR